MGGSCSTARKTDNKIGGKKRRYGRKSRTRRVRRTKRGGSSCGCSANASSSSMYGGYKYTRKASLAAEKRLSQRLSRRHMNRKHKTHRKKRRKKRKSRRRGRR